MNTLLLQNFQNTIIQSRKQRKHFFSFKMIKKICALTNCSVLFSLLWIMYLVNIISSRVNYAGPLRAFPYLEKKAYIRTGDINIGALLPITDYIGPDCSSKVRTGSVSIEYPESVAFAVDAINRNQKILPNLTLGFVILNDCSNENIALAEAMSFLPRVKQGVAWDPDLNTSSSLSDVPMPAYDVIAVISPTNSQPAVMVSQLMTIYRIPVVGITATSDALSDKTSHPYFLRVTPPDRYQVSAMLRFLSDQGWSYVSLLYVQGSYGEKAYETFRLLAPSFRVCLATWQRMEPMTDYDLVVKDLLNYPRARVVILFTYASHAKSVFAATRKLNATGHFIWIGSDGLGSIYRIAYQGFEQDITGMFVFLYYSSLVEDLYDHIRTINVTESSNPWFKMVWENLMHCSFSNHTCNTEDDIIKRFFFYPTSSLYIDAVWTVAHGAHNMISALCPGATGDEARRCISNGPFYEYLRNTSFVGYNGIVKFDSVGDLRGSYKINQLVLDKPRVPFVDLNSSSIGPELQLIGVYSIESREIRYTKQPISWQHVSRGESVLPAEIRPLALAGVPESVCSRPCTLSEYMLQKDPVCCWECRECRDNEKLIDNYTGCQVCDKYTWPDDNDFTICVDIPLSHHTVTDTLPLIQLCLGLVALFCTCLIVLSYVYFRETRVIKAASRELSILQMVAIFVGYLTIILFQIAPTPRICGVLYFTFCLSFTWLYAPLLVKVIRIYRIFESGKSTQARPRFVSPQSQLLMTFFLITIQVIICLYIYTVYKPTARKTQPVLTEKYVELSCDMTLPGLVSFLAYNLILVCLCIVFAFKTRALPDNFNESRFISMCVSTTLIIWLAFITTYFTASRDFVRAMVLSVTLLLNHTVAVVFLYVPKIYAAVYLSPDAFVMTRLHYGGTLHAEDHRRSNRVAPLSSHVVAANQKY